MFRLIQSVFLSLLLFLIGTAAAFEPLPTGPVPGKFIVKLRPGKGLAKSMALAKGQSIRPMSKLIAKPEIRGMEEINRYFIFNDSAQTMDETAIADLLGADNVESVEQDYYIEFFGLPSDPFFSDQWYLYNTGQSYLGIDRFPGDENDILTTKTGTPGNDVRLINQYNSPPAETTKVVVAIVDTGADTFHPQLQGRFWKNPDEIPDGIDNDHNGYIDDTLGYDVSGDQLTFFDPVGDNDVTDSVGHGTHIAGIIAAAADGIGVVGVAPFAEIMPVKIRPNATNAVAANGILYAINAGAQVISISWGTPFESGVLKEALELARRNGVFVCIAPGNTGDNTRFFPAAFDSTFVVGAGNSDGEMTYFSTYGAHVDIVAPGEDILSLRAAGTDLYGAQEPGLRIIDSLYLLADGTSMATPMVAGAAAVLLAFQPQLGLADLEEYLTLGAVDIVDPWGEGENYPGVDTITGHGYLNIDASLVLASGGGLKILEPFRKDRYTDDITVKVAPVAGYLGPWALYYSMGAGSEDWQLLVSGLSVPTDSILYLFNDTTVNGILNLKVQGGVFSSQTSVTYVRQQRVQLTSPLQGEDIQYSVRIGGSAFGPDFDSMTVDYRKESGSVVRLLSSTAEHFDSLLYNWTISGLDTGSFMITLTGYFPGSDVSDSVGIHISSGFAIGWPQPLGGNGGMTPVCADLDNDGSNELIVGTSLGLVIYQSDGIVRPGFPVPSSEDARCVPAIYDIDRDDSLEIIFTSDSAIHAINSDGSYVPGWPVKVFTGITAYQYAYPTPVITELGYGEDSAVVIVNGNGQIMAYEFNGDPYFYSLDGLFGSVGVSTNGSNVYNGSVSPVISATDLDGDNLNEVVICFSSSHYGGLILLEGRTGRPAYGMQSGLVQPAHAVNGATLADLDNDGLHEVVMLAYQSVDVGGTPEVVPVLYAKKNGMVDLPGWPVVLTELPRHSWIGSFPIAADLDLDDSPEILMTFFTFAKSFLYIFNSDGSPYSNNGFGGRAFELNQLAATPSVGNLTGDEYPEIAFRTGHLLPGTGSEYLYVLDNGANLLEGYPIVTPSLPAQVISSRFAPLIHDTDNDGLQELALIGDNSTLMIWDFDGQATDGPNRGRFLGDNLNSSQFPLGDPAFVTNVDDLELGLPKKVTLSQNYPNPFNPATLIQFTLPQAQKVRLEIINLLGQIVETVLDGTLDAGPHQVTFDGSELASGLYFYRLKTDDGILVRKMVLLK
ncbi:MAG: S8 family peptidase [bacterium]|nr:S8 family peptidase [bacterium]